MSNIETELADIERELLALTGNQPPNPAQITTFAVSGISAAPFEEKTIVFEGGDTRWIQIYSDNAIIYPNGSDLKVIIITNGIPYTVISLGEFTLV